MHEELTYYQILGVNNNSTMSEIRSAYKKLALEYHPDKNPDDPSAQEKFKTVSEAYQTLIDVEKKHEYDLKLKNFYLNTKTLREIREVKRQTRELIREMQFKKTLTGLIYLEVKKYFDANIESKVVYVDLNFIKIKNTPIDMLIQCLFNDKNKYILIDLYSADIPPEFLDKLISELYGNDNFIAIKFNPSFFSKIDTSNPTIIFGKYFAVNKKSVSNIPASITKLVYEKLAFLIMNDEVGELLSMSYESKLFYGLRTLTAILTIVTGIGFAYFNSMAFLGGFLSFVNSTLKVITYTSSLASMMSCCTMEEWIENYTQEIKNLTENFMMNITAENLVNYLPLFLILPEVPYKPLIVYLAEKKELFIKAVEKCVEQLPSDEKKLEYMESVLHEGSMLKAVLSYQRGFFSRYTIGFFSNTTTVSTLVHKVQELKAICDKTKSEKETLAEQSFALITINK